MERQEEEESSKLVNSTAIVKYSAVQTPANFARLQCNTDLNLPPSNWLSSSANSYGLQHVSTNSTGFSSFRMAHMFPDCVGEVDVVSDAENIKKLLKLPYSQGPVSMMVHRIENTLLIDNFDIYKHLLRTAETEWDWLKKFFFDNIQIALNEKDRGLYRRGKSRNTLQQRSLMSKFLYHSLVESTQLDRSAEVQGEPSTRLPSSGPSLPEPSVEQVLPDPATKHRYNRNVVWTFENIQMLIGTDMPIFGGSTHPCISLRLRDMSKPISVLTGIDYWLDNLMSNVPEVIMCYHLEGIVERYEVVKTEDLPHLENSEFSPKLIRDIAQNILSFLKSNATKAGHTYWLFKGRNDDVVKLYDLTSLCSGVLDENGQNPFTVPVAMLLYRVARNMKHSPDGASQLGTIKMLLKNCIELLNREKYPQIVTSSHYMLSDLYVPAHTNPTQPGFESSTHDEYADRHYDDDDVDDSFDNSDNDAIKQIRLSETTDQDGGRFKYKTAPPITGSIKERCTNALQHVAAGLNCLQYFPSNIIKTKDIEKEREKLQKVSEEQNLKMAHPFEPIPMPYPLNRSENNVESKRKKTKKRSKNEKKSKKVIVEESDSRSSCALLPNPKVGALPTWQEPHRSDDVSWHSHLKTLLYEKACLVYAILAEQEFTEENYGDSLRYISALVKCHKILKSLQFSSQHVQESCLLGRTGDCCCMIEKHWANSQDYIEQYFRVSEVEDAMSEEINKDYPAEDDNYEKWNGLLPVTIESNEQMLQISCRCYERALASEPGTERRNLLRRLGNVQNELGTLYMNLACVEVNNGSTNVKELISKSTYNLEAGIRSFESIDDKANLALLYSNMGRLMRLCAHISSDDSNKNKEIVGVEKMYYNKALSNYQRARQVIINRSNNPDIWDAITWELSTASFYMATLLQDYPVKGARTHKELEQEVVELLHKALEFCDMETPSYRQPIYQYRGAKIHHRLASLYHNSFRKMTKFDSRRKNTILLCKLHYERAATIMSTLEDSCEYLTIQLEYVAFYQLFVQNATAVVSKYKHLQFGLNLILDCLPLFISISTRKVMEINDEEEYVNTSTEAVAAKALREKEKGLICLLKSQLQLILLNLTNLTNKPVKGITLEHCSTYGPMYKELYTLSLRICSDEVKIEEISADLVKTLSQIKERRAQVPELNL